MYWVSALGLGSDTDGWSGLAAPLWDSGSEHPGSPPSTLLQGTGTGFGVGGTQVQTQATHLLAV